MAASMRRLLPLLLTCLLIGPIWGATKCYKNEDLGDAEDNVYHCYGEEKPECCTEKEEFTCCESETMSTLKEQLQLWGLVAGVIVLSIVLCCCIKGPENCLDTDCCSSSCLTRCCKCQCCKRKKTEPVMSTLDEPTPRETSLTANPNRQYNRLPPLPPVTPLPPLSHDLNYGGGKFNQGFNDEYNY